MTAVGHMEVILKAVIHLADAEMQIPTKHLLVLMHRFRRLNL